MAGRSRLRTSSPLPVSVKAGKRLREPSSASTNPREASRFKILVALLGSMPILSASRSRSIPGHPQVRQEPHIRFPPTGSGMVARPGLKNPLDNVERVLCLNAPDSPAKPHSIRESAARSRGRSAVHAITSKSAGTELRDRTTEEQDGVAIAKIQDRSHRGRAQGCEWIEPRVHTDQSHNVLSRIKVGDHVDTSCRRRTPEFQRRRCRPRHCP